MITISEKEKRVVGIEPTTQSFDRSAVPVAFTRYSLPFN